MSLTPKNGAIRTVFTCLALIIGLCLHSAPAKAQVTAFKQAVAEAAARDRDLAAYYKANDYNPLWIGNGGRFTSRRNALLKAIESADDYGLPSKRYKGDELKSMVKAAKTPRDRGRLEVEFSRRFLDLATSMQTGVLVPNRVISEIKRDVPLRDRASYLTNLGKSSPAGFFRALPPKSPEFTRLMKAKLTLERQLGKGGYGAKVPAKSLKPGASGNAVVALRNRLIAMGYMRRSASQSYDAELQKAVQQFQGDNGLSADGVAGAGTMAEINKDVDDRLRSVIVAMERERWMNLPQGRGKRHILVNLTDFTARIIDNDRETFRTRSVIGANDSDRRSPEFSDVMEFMVINPTWNVPRSIAVKEYLPMLKRNPNAAGHLKITDARGRSISRGAVNFNSYTEKTFPFNLKQPPSDGNALGLVKFMFPNKYNIYLHDTPSKSLFQREVRAFSHGCIRLADPFDFAYALLAKQTNDPKGLFHAHLKTGQESVVPLDEPVPVHLIYRTAFTTAKGGIEYRRDIYGRDATIWNALAREGVVLRAVGG